MQLKPPFEISARLLPSVRIENTWISICFDGKSEGRAVYRYFIDNPDFEYENNDLRSGVGGCSLQSGMESLLSFLGACAESRRYSRGRDCAGENADLFPDNVGQWAESVSDEISLLQCEIEENKNLLTD